MSDSYTKLFASITESTIVSEPVATRWLWVTMLAMANAKGEVFGSIPGLARRANISMDDTERALATFYAPDPYSRTKEHEGRRIEEIDGGWRLLNHAKYAAVRNKEERAEYMREYMREYREKQEPVNNPVNTCKQKLAELTELAPLTPTLTLEKQDQELVPHSAKSRAARLPQDWRPTDSEMRWAADARPDVDARAEVEKFRDYWHAKAGRDACKRDWAATWRNWIRNSRGSNHAIGRSNRAEGHESVADRAARFAREGNEADARRAAANRGDASIVGEDGGDLRASLG